MTFAFTPLGIGIIAALAITGIATGIVVGIKHYQAHVNTKLVEAGKDKAAFLFQEQSMQLANLEKQHLKLKLKAYRGQPDDKVDATPDDDKTVPPSLMNDGAMSLFSSSRNSGKRKPLAQIVTDAATQKDAVEMIHPFELARSAIH
jgi:hypothetical protein